MMSNNVNERDIPAEDSHGNLLEAPYSIIWRILHGISYLIGGLTFICGSCMYFTKVIAEYDQALNAGAWFYIVGSAAFLIADLQDWFYYRIGLFIISKHRKENNAASNTNHVDKEPKTCSDRYRRIQIDLNYLGSILGSILYLAGSVLFLPKFSDDIIAGDVLFITGSAAIFLSEAWKIYRLACTNAVDPNDIHFHFQNVRHNLQAIFISFFAGLGGVFYFVGTILFLPQYTSTDFGENRAAALFLCGGIFFSLAGLLLQYRYFCRCNRK
ncbi:unnamed protein product [Adineta steineri]|uniref:YrhK domain-containing protein n=1 Tax=Adineta steineri TaxID=433720 RepID=A0A819FV51_9BILA|nr:unnamed protein product [Adineta steineri]CAF3871698.1 unnamed protein product [Adineta steineri]